MPRKKNRGKGSAAAAEPEIAEVNGADEEEIEAEDAGNSQGRGGGVGGGRGSGKGRGPFLVWNRDRDHALVEAVSNEMTAAEIVEHLTSHEAFSDLPEGAVTAVKVTNRLSLLRRQGVEVPRLTRAGRYSPDVDELNDLLA